MAELALITAWIAWAAFWANRSVTRTNDAKLAQDVFMTKLLPVCAVVSAVAFAVVPWGASTSWSSAAAVLGFIAICTALATFFGGVHAALLGAFLLRRNRMRSDAPWVIFRGVTSLLAVVVLVALFPR
jgi:hypothetical protein